MKGIVTSNDLPGREIYVSLKPKFCKNILEIIRKKSTIGKFSREIGVNRIIGHWLTGGSLIRLDILRRVSKFLNINNNKIKKNIVSLRGKDGFHIKNPKISFNFKTKAGARFIAALFGDGCLDKKYRVFYANSQDALINEFIKNSREVFGEVGYDLRRKANSENVKIVSIPPICGKIVSLIGLSAGGKVRLNPNIPDFIFNLEEEKKIEFLSQIIDDEGSISLASRHLKIDFALEEIHKNSSLLDGIKKMLEEFGINSTIYQYGKYPSSRGENRKKWQLEIHSHYQLKRLYSLLNLKHKPKKQKLKQLIGSVKQLHFPTRDCTHIYLECMKQIEAKKGYFTSTDIKKYIHRKIGHIRNMLSKYLKTGLIYKVEKVRSDGRRFYPAKYKLSNFKKWTK